MLTAHTLPQSVDELANTAVLVALRATRGDTSARKLITTTQDASGLLAAFGCTNASEPPGVVMEVVAHLAARLADDDALRGVSERVQARLDGAEWASLAREVCYSSPHVILRSSG